MKISRQKKLQKYLNFFSNNFGFRKPYQVLVDGTICHAALKCKLNIKDQFPKYLDGDAKLLTTQCVVIETEIIGGMVYGAMIILKQFAIHKCGHEGKPISASACLESMIGKENSNRYILATQDRDLQQVARNVPGTPLLYLHIKTPTLEQPSPASVELAKQRTQARFNLSEHEGETLASLRNDSLDTEVKKKKRKKGGPNSLSCKKKVKRVASVDESHLVVKNTARKRKRVRIAKHIKEHWIAEAKGTSPSEKDH